MCGARAHRCRRQRSHGRAIPWGLVPLVPGVVALEVGTFGDGGLPEWTVGVRGFLTAPEDQAVPTAKGPRSRTEMFRLSIEYVTGWRRGPGVPASGGNDEQHDD